MQYNRCSPANVEHQAAQIHKYTLVVLYNIDFRTLIVQVQQNQFRGEPATCSSRRGISIGHERRDGDAPAAASHPFRHSTPRAPRLTVTRDSDAYDTIQYSSQPVGVAADDDGACLFLFPTPTPSTDWNWNGLGCFPCFVYNVTLCIRSCLVRNFFLV